MTSPLGDGSIGVTVNAADIVEDGFDGGWYCCWCSAKVKRAPQPPTAGRQTCNAPVSGDSELADLVRMPADLTITRPRPRPASRARPAVR